MNLWILLREAGALREGELRTFTIEKKNKIVKSSENSFEFMNFSKGDPILLLGKKNPYVGDLDSLWFVLKDSKVFQLSPKFIVSSTKKFSAASARPAGSN